MIRALLDLARPDNSFHATLYTLLGAYLATDLTHLANPRVWAAVAVVALIVAYSFVINDLHDEFADRFGKPERPLPAGRVTRGAAWGWSLALAGAGLLVALTLGPLLFGFALATVALATLYSFVLKETLLLGNASIALLDASVVLYGALAVGRPTVAVWTIFSLTFLFILSQEILYTVQDLPGDAQAGVRTTANRLGRAGALNLYRVLALAFLVAASLPWWLGLASPTYLVAILLLVILPIASIVVRLSLHPTDETVHFSTRVMKVLWLTSLLPVWLLK